MKNIISIKCMTLGFMMVMLAILPLPVFGGTDVQMNSDVPGDVQNEVRLIQNATDSMNFVAAYNDKPGASSTPLGISFSLDGGLTWSDTQLSVPVHPILLTPHNIIFDPFITSDSQGNIYAGYIATDGTLGGPGGIYIERSTDKGQTWSGPTNIDSNLAAVPPGGPDPSYRFNDRSDSTVDSADNVYVVWIKDVGVGLATSDIYFSKSGMPGATSPMNPTGLNFSGIPAPSVAPQTVNDNPGIDLGNAPTVAVAPDGTVYLAWIDVNVLTQGPKPGSLMIDRSFDGGVTFGLDIVAQSITALPKNLSTTSGAGTFDDVISGSYPVIAVDPSNSLTVYMAYAADPAGADESDIFFIKSTDGGLTWSNPIRVNDDITATDQFHPDIAVKPNGTIDIVWYDKRNGANDDSWDVYITKSTDNGASFAPNVRISDTTAASPTSTTNVPWLGEYLGLVVDSNSAYVVFTSSVNDSKGDVFFDSIANSAIVPQSLEVALDIKPQSCPNPINRDSNGLIPVAILGSDNLDVSQIDVSTLELVGPGVGSAFPVKMDLEDVSTPVTNNGQQCICNEEAGDGLTDLTLKFRKKDVTNILGAANLNDQVPLSIKGSLLDGTPFTGTDCVVIKN